MLSGDYFAGKGCGWVQVCTIFGQLQAIITKALHITFLSTLPSWQCPMASWTASTRTCQQAINRSC